MHDFLWKRQTWPKRRVLTSQPMHAMTRHRLHYSHITPEGEVIISEMEYAIVGLNGRSQSNVPNSN